MVLLFGGRFRPGALVEGDAQLSQIGWGLWRRKQATSMIENWIARTSGQHCGHQYVSSSWVPRGERRSKS
jgi:hypothetical protein